MPREAGELNKAVIVVEASAAEELNSQAASLSQTVGQFRLNGSRSASLPVKAMSNGHSKSKSNSGSRNGSHRELVGAGASGGKLSKADRLIPLDDVHYLQAEEKYVIVHHAHGEDLIEESLKSLEDEFSERFVRIHRNCLVARHEITGLRRSPDGHTQAVLRHALQPLEVSRRCVAGLRETLKHL